MFLRDKREKGKVRGERGNYRIGGVRGWLGVSRGGGR